MLKHTMFSSKQLSQPDSPKNKKQIANEMGLSLRTFQRRLEQASLEVPRGLVSPEAQDEIYQKLGWRKTR